MRRSISFVLLGTAPACCWAAAASIARPTWRPAMSATSSAPPPSFPRSSPSSSIARRSRPSSRRSSFLSGHQVDRERAEVTRKLRRPGRCPRHRSRSRWVAWCCTASPRHRSPCRRTRLRPPCCPTIAGPEVVEPDQPALKQALDRVFAEMPAPPHRNTKAVVVVRDGRVIAERYAPGYGIDTQVMGWSATKSVTNALIGILVRQGKLSVDGSRADRRLGGSEGSAARHLHRQPAAHEQRPRYRRFAHRPGLHRLRSFGLHGVRRARHGGLRRKGAAQGSTRHVVELHQRQHPAAVQDHPRQHRRRCRLGARLCPARAVRQARHAPRHPRVRCRRHADRLQPHAGLGARLGALRPALPERRRGRGRAPAAAGLGRLFGRTDVGQRALRLCRGLLDQSWRRRGPALPHRPRHSGRCLLRPRCERAVRHHRALAAPGRGTLRQRLHRRATTWTSWRVWWPT